MSGNTIEWTLGLEDRAPSRRPRWILRSEDGYLKASAGKTERFIDVLRMAMWTFAQATGGTAAVREDRSARGKYDAKSGSWIIFSCPPEEP